MSISRREFFKRAATAAAVVAIAPKILSEPFLPYEVGPLPDSVFQPTPGVLTYQKLEEAYQSCVYGYDEPDLILMSKDMYGQFLTLLAPEQRFIRVGPEGEMCSVFNGAAVTYSEHLAPGTMMEINSKGRDPRISGMFRLPEWKHEPLPESET